MTMRGLPYISGNTVYRIFQAVCACVSYSNVDRERGLNHFLTIQVIITPALTYIVACNKAQVLQGTSQGQIHVHADLMGLLALA